MIHQILALLDINWYELSFLIFFIICLIIQFVFYFKYYLKPLKFAKRGTEEREDSQGTTMPKVSVIITSENESENLAINLPFILQQDYPDFEVIIVNKGSTDETEIILNKLQQDYPHLYHTYLPYSPDRGFGLRKLALTLGIKAAKGDILLFTEAYCKPISNRWIYEMVKDIYGDNKITLGYSFYKKENLFYNRLARFDNLLSSIQYLSMAIKGKPYNGVFRNVAFAKHLFFDYKGFSSFLHLDNGEDAFINQLVSDNMTTVAVTQDSFIETSLYNFHLWKQIKKSYFNVQPYFKQNGQWIFKVETISRFVFYAMAIFSIIYSTIIANWILLGLSLLIMFSRLIFQLTIINKSAFYFQSGLFYFSLPILDLLQPIYNLIFRFENRKKKRK